MKKFAKIGTAALFLGLVAIITAEDSQRKEMPAKAESKPAAQMPDMPEMAAPQKEHEWLNKLVGEWKSESEITMPGMEGMQATGRESVRSLGGFWVIADGKNEMMDMQAKSVMTLGFDPDKNKYVGTWIDSMSSYMWTYEGTVDESGNKLTLETKGYCPMKPGKLFDFRETMEFVSPDHRVFTSEMQDEDGTWLKIVTTHYHRKQ